MMIDVVIPTAGVGKRMQAAIPKQYLQIDKQCIIEHTIHKMLQLPEIGKIIVVLSANDQYFKTLPIAQHPQIVTAIGGAERADSVISGLKTATTEYVLVHDAARPCVQISDIKNLIAQATNEHGGILVARVCDTVKQTNQAHQIQQTLARDFIYRALTPQYFQRELLLDAYLRAQAQHIALTDEASAMEWAGFQPLAVVGSATNIKVTEPLDLQLATFFMHLQDREKDNE